MKLYPIQCGKFKLDGGAMFGVVPKSIWQKTNPADEKNLVELGTRSLLIEDGKKLIWFCERRHYGCISYPPAF